jgi:hypothetical protein
MKNICKTYLQRFGRSRVRDAQLSSDRTSLNFHREMNATEREVCEDVLTTARNAVPCSFVRWLLLTLHRCFKQPDSVSESPMVYRISSSDYEHYPTIELH